MELGFGVVGYAVGVFVEAVDVVGGDVEKMGGQLRFGVDDLVRVVVGSEVVGVKESGLPKGW